MKYSYNWLKELSGVRSSVEKVVENLTMKSFEVEGLEKVGGNLEGVVVGKILEITKHPNADKLRIAKTDVGKEKLQIVCGAPNIEVGQKVPVALIGTKLPAGFEIKEAEIRGVKSFGMICAEDELGLGDDHSGILVLDPKCKVGASFIKEMGIEDYVLEIKILPDRGHDAQSHVGVAREMAVLENKKLDYDFDGLKLPNKKTKKLAVEIKDKKLCPRYIGAVMENIEIKESPAWIKNRLTSSGIRPINNIVDATNYVMLELGQPMHAFDFDEISRGKAKIIVRKAKKGEKIILLDESVKELDESDLVIANEDKALAIAGIMGGQHSGINERTKTIVLESANFNATSIRKTRTKLNIKTDASDRYEKEIDPNLTEKAMVRLIEIIEHIAGGQLDGIADVYPQKVSSWKIKLDLEYVSRLLGEKVASKKVKEILNLLEIKTSQKGKFIEAQIPTFRIDLKTQEDLIEEIGRVYGYEKIEPQAPLVSISPALPNEGLIFAKDVKNILTSLGFSEIYNYSFYSKRDANLIQLGTIKHLELANPMNPDQELARVSLIPNLLKNVRENLKNFKELYIFEIGKIFWLGRSVLPEEKDFLTGALVLEKNKEEKQDKRNESAFFEVKSSVDSLLAQIGITDQYYDSFEAVSLETPASLWHISRTAAIKISGSEETIGFVGEVSPLVLEQFGIRTRVAMFEFDLEKLQLISEQEREFVPIAKYPAVVRDISLVVGRGVLVDEILMTIQKGGGELVSDVDLFDAIDFADNTSSFAFHIIFSADRTLTGQEIDEAMNTITEKLEKELDVKVRK
ncbi:MAG TPA: phenylalanine--tRNA ligase subunit beta [Candidatus Moranbacteria bacterium]|nr:phenylalanine--tRNA ligase subunit beta [Candidatus Moranbacteria bacterium]